MSSDNQVFKTMLAPRPSAPVLRVSYNDVSDEHLLIEQRITIGRTSDNTIMIPLRTVSRLHAVLTATANGYVIIDQQSTNGLLYRGRRIQEHRLVNGDILRISDELGNFATLIYYDSTQPVTQRFKTVSFSSQQRELTIGRAADNSLVLDHPQVSAQHARIRRDEHGMLLQDLGSTNGTYLHGQRVTQARIVPGDVFQIAGYELICREDLIEQSETTHDVRLDAIDLYKVVNNGMLLVLNNVSLSIYPREMVAIVGGSGTGKSSLMGALNGFAPAPQGRVLVNGSDYYQHAACYRSTSGYVPQDNTLHRELTVERTLYYAARLRLPPDVSAEELDQRIQEALVDVGLSAFRSFKVVHLSGGQRKRLSIAVELLARPNLFFLDEPTTGLDPGLDKRMMLLLRNLADKGCTIVLVTHATANIMMCDTVAFLARGGRLCFYGPPREALNFFETGEFSDIYARLEQSSTSGTAWEERFKQSYYYEDYVGQRLAQVDSQPDRPAAAATQPVPRAASGRPGLSVWRQGWLLASRYAEILWQDRFNLLLLLAQAPLSGFIIGMVSPTDIFANGTPPTAARNMIFLLAIAAVLLGVNNAAREIAREAPLYRRERLANLRVVPYVLSKIAVLAALCLVQSILLVAVVSPFSGIPPGALLPGSIEWMISVWLASLAGAAMGLFISALAATSNKALSLVPLVLVPQIMLAGLIFPLRGPTELLSYAVITRWATDSLGTTADLNRLYYLSLSSAPPGIRPVPYVEAASHFDPTRYDGSPGQRSSYSIQDHTASRRLHLLKNWGILLALAVGFVALTCYVQKRKDHF